MGAVGTCFRLVFFVILPLVVIGIAAFIGVCRTQPIPMGYFFESVFLLSFRSHMETPPVPAAQQLLPRPSKELFTELPSGHKMPMSGIGMCCRPNAYHHASVRRQVMWYLVQGGRHIDGAELYLNHVPMGEGIQDAIRMGVPRSEIFVTTKIWPDFFGTEQATKAIKRFLKDLQLDYIDLVLMHSPRRNMGLFSFDSESEFKDLGCSSPKECRQQTWMAMTEARKQGLIKEAGVSNFRVSHLKEIQELQGGAPIAANQIQFHPWSQSSQIEIYDYCRANGINVVGYNSLGGSMEKDAAFSQAALKEIATAHGVSVGQVLLRWSIQKGVTVIPGTGNPKHMAQNLGVYSFELSEAEMAKMAELQQDKVVTSMPSFLNADG